MRRVMWLATGLLLASSVISPAVASERATVADAVPSAAALQAIVDELRSRLAIRDEVVVEIVSSNTRLLSVTRHRQRHEQFHLSIEEAFLHTLTADEREAALAHELGHVWIFTNHPYLQTEQLANRIALQVVTRDSLARVYEKMWTRSGAKGDLTRLLGEAPLSAAAAAADIVP